MTTKKKTTATKQAARASATKRTRKATRANTTAGRAKDKPKATSEAKTSGGATQAAPGKRGDAPGNTKKRTGILDAAAQILSKTKEPMVCKAIVEQAIARGIWSTGGKTPHATLSAAINREIAKKGEDARFEKVERGRFQICSGKKGA